jgi:nucleoside-diphosphate-sugar epimerase
MFTIVWNWKNQTNDFHVNLAIVFIVVFLTHVCVCSSTMSVLNADSGRAPQKPLSPWLAARLDGYPLSKFIAESIVHRAAARVPCFVARLGTIFAARDTGGANPIAYGSGNCLFD